MTHPRNPLGYLTAAPAEADTLPQDLHRIREAAALTGMARSTIYRRFRRGDLSFYGFERCYYVSLRDLLPRVSRTPPKPLGDSHKTKTGVRRAPRPSVGGLRPPKRA